MDEKQVSTEQEESDREVVSKLLSASVVNLDLMTAKAIAKVINYSFEPVDYVYEQLTSAERSLISKDDFAYLAGFAKTVLAAEVQNNVPHDGAGRLDPEVVWSADVSLQDLQSGYSGALGPLYTALEHLRTAESAEEFGKTCGAAVAYNLAVDGDGRIMISFHFPLPDSVKVVKGGTDAEKQ